MDQGGLKKCARGLRATLAATAAHMHKPIASIVGGQRPCHGEKSYPGRIESRSSEMLSRSRFCFSVALAFYRPRNHGRPAMKFAAAQNLLQQIATQMKFRQERTAVQGRRIRRPGSRIAAITTGCMHGCVKSIRSVRASPILFRPSL